MPDHYIEKSFIYLLVLSLILHAVLFALFLSLPDKKMAARTEPIMIDLEDMPELQQAPRQISREDESRRSAERRQRVQRETAPKGERERDRVAALPPSPPAPAAPRAAAPSRPGPAVTGEIPVRQAPTRGGGILKPRSEVPDVAQLMPSADRLAKLEDSYRKKYSAEVTEGETKFLDTDDIQFGSFLRRFESAVYGVWRYPAEAARLGIEGVVPVKITFDNKGAIEKYEVLQSSGSRILDDEVARTLRLVGPVGSFPRGYQKDKFHLIAFFQYGILRGVSRSLH